MRSRKGLFRLCWERVRRLPVALVYCLPWLAGRVLQALVGAQERLAVGAVVVHILQGIYAEWDEAAASNTSGRRDKEHITGCGRRLRAAKNMGSCICAGTPEGPFTAWRWSRRPSGRICPCMHKAQSSILNTRCASL